MATRVVKEIVAITGKYKDGAGKEKNRYAKIGVVMEKDDGARMIKLESIPVGWDGWAYLNDPKDNSNGNGASHRQVQQQQAAGQSRGASGFDDFEDDIPF
jgi:hypothetical protein